MLHKMRSLKDKIYGNEVKNLKTEIKKEKKLDEVLEKTTKVEKKLKIKK